MPSQFKGTIEEYEKDRAAEKAAAEAKAKEAPKSDLKDAPPAPPAKAEDKPVEKPVAPEEPKVETKEEPAPAAAAAQKKRYKFDGKVAGEKREWELDEDDLTNPESEGHKKLVERFQKAEDYDRPGGAMDQKAAKIASERHAAYMVENKLWVPDGKGGFTASPDLAAYHRWRAEQAAAQQPRPAQQPAQQPQAAQTPRQQRIAELQAKYDNEEGGPITGKEMREFQQLVSDEQFEAREAARDARHRADLDKQENERASQQAAQDRAAQAQAHIDSVVESLRPQLRDPLTGEVDPVDIDNAKRHMTASVLETQDWAKAEQSVRAFAARQAQRIKALVDKIPKQATAPAPAPVHRGQGDGKPAKEPESDDYDPRKPFSKQTGKLGDWEKAHRAASPA